MERIDAASIAHIEARADALFQSDLAQYVSFVEGLAMQGLLGQVRTCTSHRHTIGRGIMSACAWRPQAEAYSTACLSCANMNMPKEKQQYML